ncbi:MAG: ABC transporter substrate-binding protein [Lentisphaeria bacterium]|nr:ABC transporter substrate-binding protein [Lentisphaeria bacterium]
MRHFAIAILTLGIIIALPLVLRRRDAVLLSAPRKLVVVTANNEALRHETELAFREYHKKRNGGEEVSIDWRTIGGTSEIVRFIQSAFAANARHAWEMEGRGGWDDAVGAVVFDGKLPAEEGVARDAWKWFRESDIGIDMDVMLGGGQYDHDGLRRSGFTVPTGVRSRHKEWFEGENPIMSSGGGGEKWYDPDDCYYAVCFSTFGIVYNRDRLAQAGFSADEIEHFGEHWRDLADPRLYGAIGIADPSQSGSITKCFEMLIQREMQDVIGAMHPGEEIASVKPTQDELNEAWCSAMLLLKQLGGNAAYLTFSASKVPVDAATGQIAAGMCIDFYGRSQVEWEKSQVGRETISYRTPAAASTVSADPVSILRGARDRELAEEFVDFLLSREAQTLWGKQAGAQEGPKDYTLYRLPVRRDMYEGTALENTVFGDERPFELASSFTYRGDWTGALFSAIRVLVKTMLIECGPELRDAWGSIIARGGMDALSPEERAAFAALPFSHAEAREATRLLGTPEEQALVRRHWIEFFRENYRLAR